jgi:hypothetical protein
VNILQGEIHDNGKNDALDFDLSGWSPVVHGIRTELNKQRDERYKSQLDAWVVLADKRHTQAEIEAIQADQDRRVKGLR